MRREDYRAACVGGGVWDLVDSVASGKRALVFPPGGLAFGTVGFLGSFPGAILLFFLQSTIFQTESLDFQGYFMIFGGAITILVHCLLMLRVCLGNL
jgi:hypothetical protein